MTQTITAHATKLGDLLALRAMVPLTDGRNVGELHIATEGSWEGHAQGPFKFTGETFDSMIERFEAQSNPMVVDYEHRTFNEAAPDSTAAGWIQKLDKRMGPDGWELWAVVEWTEPAAAKIKTREYQFCSPAFAFKNTDRETGEKVGPELQNVALTNYPFLDGNKPIRLSWLAAQTPPPKPKPEDDEDEHGETDAAPPPADDKQVPPAADPNAPPPEQPPPSPESDQQRALAEQLTAAIDQMAKTSGLDRVAVVEQLLAMADRVGGLMRDAADQDGTPADQRKMSMSESTKDTPAAGDEAEIARIKAKAAEQDTKLLSARLEKLEQLEAERVAREKAEKDKANKARIDAMIECGALSEDERGDDKSGATWLLSNHPDQFEQIYKNRTGLGKAVPIGESQAGADRASVIDPDKATPADLSESEGNVYRMLCQAWGPGSEQRALTRVIARRNKSTAASRGAKVG